jgi:hypothetical protein
VARESPMSRASGTDRARRSSLGTTRVSPGWTAARAWSSPGRLRVGADEAVVEVDPLGVDAELQEGLVLGGEVLFVGGAAGVADPDSGHDRQAYG